MALAVVISPNGIPVSSAPSPFGLPVVLATNGFGVPVTPVASGGRPVFDTGGTLFGPATSAPVAAFLARTSGLDTTHINAYTALINGLVSDGVWSKLDVLHIYATQDSTTALLNLVSTSYNGTANGSPSFTADRGFTGVSGSGTVYIDTGFNPITAVSPKYVNNSAHLSAWLPVNTAPGYSDNMVMGALSSSTGSKIIPRNTSAQAVLQINQAGSNQVVASLADQVGHYLANRSDANNIQGYRNAVSLGTSAASPSGGLCNGSIPVLSGLFTAGPAFAGNPSQVAAASIGSSLSSTDATNFYNRLRTYMTAVGVP